MAILFVVQRLVTKRLRNAELIIVLMIVIAQWGIIVFAKKMGVGFVIRC